MAPLDRSAGPGLIQTAHPLDRVFPILPDIRMVREEAVRLFRRDTDMDCTLSSIAGPVPNSTPCANFSAAMTPARSTGSGRRGATP